MKKQILMATALLLLTPVIAFADEIRLTSTKTQSIDLNIVTATATTVTVDWGDGNPVPVSVATTDVNGSTTTLSGIPLGEIVVKGDGITLFDCNMAAVTALNLSAAPNLIKLLVNNNSLSTLNLSSNTALYSLHAELNPALTSLDVSKNTELGLIYCNDNNMTSLDVSQNTKLTTLYFNNNKISSIDLSKNTALKSIYGLNNLLQTIDLSNNTSLTYVSLNTNKLVSIDVTALTLLKSLFLLNNNITELKGANDIAKNNNLNCAGNKLNFATLPQPGALKTTFTYAPQQALEIQASIQVNELLDLSAQNNVKGILTAPVATTYAWATKTGTALVKGTDYEETNGVFKFLLPQTEKVICTLSSTAFPKFATTAAFKTTELSVVAADKPTGMEDVNNSGVRIKTSGASNTLIINADNQIHAVEIFNMNGKRMRQITAQEKEVQVATDKLPAGVYVIRVATEKDTAVLKYTIH